MTDINLGRVLANRYRVDLLLATSEFAPLYRGTNTVVERPVLIRILAAEFSDFGSQMLDEARELSRISNPNILSVMDIGTDTDNTAYVVYEDFDGETLLSAMNRDGKMPVAEAVGIATQIAEGVTAVSTVKNSHGAISPGNVLVSDVLAGPRCIKLFNFSSPETCQNTAPEFTAPEVVNGVPANERSDVYSLGAVLFTMLAGEPPFAQNESLEELPPPPLSSVRTDLPPDLEPSILTALAKNPEMRYQTVAEFAQHLDGVSAQPASTAAAQGNNNLWKTAFIVLAGIAILAAALIYATSVKQTDPGTQLRPDANGLPVQPINPATGAQEQALANMAGMPSEVIANSNMAIPPGTLPGGDGYDAWRNGGGKPPAGAPNIGTGGPVISIDPNNPSQFMPAEGCIMQPSGILLCPAPLNANAAKKPTPTPKNNANTQASPTQKTTPEEKPAPTPEKTPVKPATQKTPVPKPTAKPGDTE